MSQRITTEWLCYFLALYAGALWSPARGVSVPVRTPPNNPSTIQAQAKFFQYRHLPTSEDFDQGHRLGSEQHFTERHERSRPKDGLFSAKVRWGDKKGGYGEHYWDLNHAGHTGNNHGDDGYDNGSDDGSYHEQSNDPYDEPSDHSPSYDTDEYSPESASYEDRERAKRHHPRIKVERKHTVETYEEDQPKLKRMHKEQLQTAATHQTETKDDKKRSYKHQPKNNNNDYDDEEEYRKDNRQDNRPNNQQDNEEKPKEKKQVVLVVSHRDKDAEQHTVNQQSQIVPKRQPDVNHYVPYESGAGVRQHQHAEVTAAASVPRLFLERSTGHVVDRATGQAYVLQPIINNY